MTAFAIHQHELVKGIHVFPHPELTSLLPPHPILLGCPRAPVLDALLHALNLHWSSVLHMVMYMFQCWDPLWLSGKKKKKIVLCLCFFFLKKTVIIRMFFRFCVPSKNCIHCVVFKFTCFFFFSWNDGSALGCGSVLKNCYNGINIWLKEVSVTMLPLFHFSSTCFRP